MDVIVNYNDPEVVDKVYVKTNIGGWFFDAIFQTDYTRELYITQFPVETGASISDHSYIKPVKLVFQIGMSDVATSLVSWQFTGESGRTRSLTAFDVIAQLQTQRIPVNIQTRLGGFGNMLVQSISIPDDYKTLHGLRASVTMQEIFVASTTTVKISANPQTTDSTNRGNPEPLQLNGSILNQALTNFGVSA